MAHNKDYKKELPEGQKPIFLKNRVCPECDSKIVALPPDRAWCESSDCNYGEMHIIGDGVMAEQMEV